MSSRLRFSLLLPAIAGLLLFSSAVRSAPLAIAPAGFGFGPDYAQANLLVYPNCTARSLRGTPGTLIGSSNGGVDGFDCGLNLVVQIAAPFVEDISAPGPQLVKIGEAALNERAMITLGLFPASTGLIPRLPGGDGQNLDNLKVFTLLDVNGTVLRFDGTPSFYQGGPPASGNPALIAICDTPNHPNLEFTPQCVNDAALDFQIDFVATGNNSVIVGGLLYTFAVDTLAFYNNNVIPLNAVVTVTPLQAVSEPHPLLLVMFALVLLAFTRRIRAMRTATHTASRPGPS